MIPDPTVSGGLCGGWMTGLDLPRRMFVAASHHLAQYFPVTPCRVRYGKSRSGGCCGDSGWGNVAHTASVEGMREAVVGAARVSPAIGSSAASVAAGAGAEAAIVVFKGACSVKENLTVVVELVWSCRRWCCRGHWRGGCGCRCWCTGGCGSSGW